MNETFIFTLWLIGFAVGAIIIVVICYSAVARAAFARSINGSDEPLKALMSRGGGLQFVSVVMVILSALVLSINKVIDPQAAVAMLSGALGYAFGQGHRRSKQESLPQSN